MKNHFILILFVILFLIPGKVLAKTETVSFTRYENQNISGINVGSSFNIEIIESSNTEAVFEIDAELEKYVKSSLKSGTLTIEVKKLPKNKRNNPHLKMKLYTPEINKITASGASSIKLNGKFETNKDVKLTLSGASKIENSNITTPKVTINCSGASKLTSGISATVIRAEVSGASKAELNIDNADNVTLRSSGASNITAKGISKTAKISTSGASSIKAAQLKTEYVNADASGASQAIVHATKSFNGEASGASQIKYGGTPASVKMNSSKSSSISKIK